LSSSERGIFDGIINNDIFDDDIFDTLINVSPVVTQIVTAFVPDNSQPIPAEITFQETITV